MIGLEFREMRRVFVEARKRRHFSGGAVARGRLLTVPAGTSVIRLLPALNLTARKRWKACARSRPWWRTSDDTMKNLLSIEQLTRAEMEEIFHVAAMQKQNRASTGVSP